MTVKTTSQILDEAADILAEEGCWTKGEWHEPCATDPNGVSHCADGAIEYAAGLVINFLIDEELALHWDRVEDDELEAAYEQAYQAACGYVRNTLGHSGGIVHYNDDKNRTQEEVVAALRGAADQQRALEAATPAA